MWPELNEVKVPTEVMFGCAAVCKVPCNVVAVTFPNEPVEV